MYEKPIKEPELELVVTVLNINPGKNEVVTKSCKTLKEYMLYTKKVRENLLYMNLDDAVSKAVEDCIREDILAEFLKKNRAEAVEVSIFEYDEEKHLKTVREEGREEGADIKGMEIFLNMLSKGYSKEEAQALTDISDELVAKAMEKQNREN